MVTVVNGYGTTFLGFDFAEENVLGRGGGGGGGQVSRFFAAGVQWVGVKELQADTGNWRQAWENAFENISFEFGFPSNWLRRKWCERLSSKQKTVKKTQIILDTQLELL